MLRTAVAIYLSLASIASIIVEGWSMTQPLDGRFPSEDWVYWHPIVFTLSVMLFATAAGLIHLRRRWWAVTAALAPLSLGGAWLLTSSRTDFLGYLVLGSVAATIITIKLAPSPRQAALAFTLSLPLSTWWFALSVLRILRMRQLHGAVSTRESVLTILAVATPLLASILLAQGKRAEIEEPIP